ncbi:iron-containing alcohol dehydrogenase [Bacillus sp. FJAT-50079]|uniref:iron-containing alcohol dehydrogenase n=1 Tax=Bacillus sp. FJAT-50079 TaxID=2833577 RepID=UPI001BC93873|nr:iron-containing alcohol dehydrogenase [Bacillus sp. FJAT-50079]MBS4206611.1 iron-containing alcohol dehydrogenase [Bacillus sp. FJAT-50079]
MENFTYSQPTNIIFGKNTHVNIGEEVKKYSNNILLHYGGGSIKNNGVYDAIISSLKKEGIKYQELSDVKPNPRLTLVRQGIEICKTHDIDFILAVGGGSVIDSAKAIGVGMRYKGDVWDFYTKKALPKETLPIGVVLTIAAAGSEASGSSVITNEDGWYKRPLDTDVIKPAFAILNPELTYTLPKFQTMCGVADIMSHVMERYFTNVEHTDLTDRLCEATLKTVIDQARIVLEEPENYDARAEIMWAGTLAHNGLLDTGRVGDWGTHMIEHEVSGIYDVAHGAGLAAIFPGWMRYVYKENPERFVQFSTRVWDVEHSFGDEESIILEGISRYENFLKEIALPTKLSELNISNEKFEEMAEKCVKYGPIGNFKKLNQDDVFRILELCL